MSDNRTPLVSTVITTRDRGAAPVKTVETVLACSYPSLEVIVVDQSESRSTEDALAPFCEDSRLVYVKTATRGLARGRNVGVSRANGEIIAFTDDDCEVSPVWLQALAEAFSHEPAVGMVFGNVVAGLHNRKLGFIPTYVRRDTSLARSLRQKHKVEGIGACMAVHRRVWEALGGFDEAMGAGSEFRSAEDFDLAMRALAAEYAIYETPSVWVVHNGFRTWDSGPALLQDSLLGLGGCMAKQLKRGHWQVVELLVHLAWRWAVRSPLWRQTRAALPEWGQPRRGFRVGAFAKGFVTGLRTPLDPNGHFTPFRKDSAA